MDSWHRGDTLAKVLKEFEIFIRSKTHHQSIMANSSVVSLKDWKMSGATNNAGARRKSGGGLSD